jgi:hypothetical protein
MNVQTGPILGIDRDKELYGHEIVEEQRAYS